MDRTNPASKSPDDITTDVVRRHLIAVVTNADHALADPGRTDQDHPLHFDADADGIAV